MTYEATNFGDGVSTTRVSSVSNSFGPRKTGGAKGVVKTEGSNNQASITFDSADVKAGKFPLETDLTIPKGAVIKGVYAEVFEALDVGANVLIGTDTSEATNGFVFATASAEAVGTYDLTSTLTGTWAAPLAADTIVSVAAVGGATVGGKAKVIVEYIVVGA